MTEFVFESFIFYLFLYLTTISCNVVNMYEHFYFHHWSDLLNFLWCNLTHQHTKTLTRQQDKKHDTITLHSSVELSMNIRCLVCFYFLQWHSFLFGLGLLPWATSPVYPPPNPQPIRLKNKSSRGIFILKKQAFNHS